MRRLAGVLAALTMWTTGASEAHAAPACTYDGAGTVTATAGGAGISQFTVINATSMTFDGVGCAGATTANTTAVNINTLGNPILLNLNVAAPATVFTITNSPDTLVADSGSNTVAKWKAGALADNRRVVDLDEDGLADVVTSSPQLVLSGLGGNDVLSAAGGFAGPGGAMAGPTPGVTTQLWGGSGDDTLTGPATIEPDDGNDTVHAAATGTTFLNYASAPQAVRMSVGLSGTETAADGWGTTDTYVGFNAAGTVLWVDGGFGDDVLRGGSGADRLRGADGVDTLDGGPGNDQLGGFGSQAGDVLRGGPGADTLQGGTAGEIFEASDGEADVVGCGGGTDSGRADRVDTLATCEFGPPVLSLAPAAVAVDEGGIAQLSLNLSYAIEVPAAVDVTTVDGTAAGGSDYTPVTRRVTIPAGQTTATVEVPTLTDAEDEPAQTFTLALANPSSAPAVGTGSTVTIGDANTPTTTITVGPEPGTGTGGIHRVAPTVAVAASDSEVRCILDPATTPATFADLPEGSCAYAGAGQKVAGDGPHRLCAASRSPSSGDTSAVACATWTTDATPPVVTCASKASFLVGDVGKAVTAGVADATSGALYSAISAAAATATSGEKTATLVGQDKAGNTTTVQCAYSVSSVALCGQPLVLLNVQLVGRRVELGGLAAATYAGQTVTITAAGRRVGTARVAGDGTFSLKATAPRASQRSKIRYRATLPDGSATPALKLSRALIITKRRGNTVYGRIVAPKAKRPKRVAFYRQNTCTSRRVFARAKVSRSGTFRVRLSAPAAPERIALYRVIAAIGKGASYTLPIVVTPSAR